MESKLDVIANNLANMETTAFKADRANFEDLFYNHEKYPGAEDTSGQYTPTGIAIGYGSTVSSVQSNFVQGAFRQTGEALDLAIEGEGFFQVLDPSSGETVYTRAGNFSLNSNGEIVMGSASTGRLLEPSISIPEDATAISVSAEGIVSVKQPGTTELSTVGQIELARFINPEGLLKMGENLYSETGASGTATLSNPGQDGVGVVRQNMLEASNVRAGHRTDRTDYHAAVLRTQLEGHPDRRRAASNRDQSEAVLKTPSPSGRGD